MNTRDQLRIEGFGLIEENLNYLLGCLHDALQSTGETDLLPLMPWSGAEPDPSSKQSPEKLPKLYSIGFQLLNIVEERVASEIRREREKALGAESIRGLWPQALRDLKNINLTPEQILSVLQDIHIEPVLTAHPTEAKRSSVRERQRALYEEIVRNEYPKYTQREKRRIRQRVISILETLWLTAEIHLVRPDIQSELRNTIHYLRDLFPTAINRLDLHFTEAWRDAGLPLELLRSAGNIPHLRFGTWIGGDRDGHPLVTPKVTENSLLELRIAAFQLLDREMKNLASQLTISRQLATVPEELQDRIDELSFTVTRDEEVKKILERHAEEPWRQLADLIALRLHDQTLGKPGYNTPDELTADLDLISRTLTTAGCTLLEEQAIRPVRHKIEIFGFHLATLDIRQNSEFHDNAIAELLAAANIPDGDTYPTWPEEKRLAFLNAELLSNRPFLHDLSRIGTHADNVLDSYRVLVHHRAKWGTRGIGALIVSMTRQLSDLLGVYLLAREAGLMDISHNGLQCPLNIVPLFETMDDLHNSPQILSAYLDHPLTQRSLQAISVAKTSSPSPSSGHPLPTSLPTQQIMLGYSDSNKDCGILAAQVALHRAQTALTRIGQEKQTKLCFFHGRGGTISRGAGPTHWFMAALPHGAMSGSFRMTEQGETIAQKYANLANATYNLELLLAGAAINTAKHRHTPETPDPAETFLDTLSATSQAAYQNLLHTQGFIDFYRQATPIDALENARIGSRPARRTGNKSHSISDLRAIPWVFSWTQARFYLPGWFGVGSALSQLKKSSPENFTQLRTALKSSTFLAYILTNVETNLASANLDLFQQYSSLVTDTSIREKFTTIITDEFNLTKQLLAELFEGDMASRRPRMAKTLDIREAPLKILHHQQIALLKHWRGHLEKNDQTAADSLLPKLLLSINAIASGLRTTG